MQVTDEDKKQIKGEQFNENERDSNKTIHDKISVE